MDSVPNIAYTQPKTRVVLAEDKHATVGVALTASFLDGAMETVGA